MVFFFALCASYQEKKSTLRYTRRNLSNVSNLQVGLIMCVVAAVSFDTVVNYALVCKKALVHILNEAPYHPFLCLRTAAEITLANEPHNIKKFFFCIDSSYGIVPNSSLIAF